jgi:MFS family permease
MNTRLVIVGLMLAFSIISYFDRTIMSIAGPDIMREFRLSETQMGAIYSAFVFGYALAMIPGGFLVDRLGPARTLAAIGVTSAGFTALTAYGVRPGLGALFGIVPALLLVRSLLGISTAPLYPSCARMIGDQFSRTQRGLIWGLVAAGAGVGSALSPSLFPWSISRYGWRGSFVLAGCVTAAIALAWWLCVRDMRHGSVEERVRHEARVSLRALLELVSTRNVALLSIGYFTVSYFEYIFFYWIYYYFKVVRNFPPSQVTLYSTAIFLSWVVMTPTGGFVSDLLVRKIGGAGRAIVAITGIVGSVLVFVLGTKTTGPWTGFLYALSFGLISSSDGPFWSATVQVGRERAGAACGILNTGSNVGGFIAPLLTPVIASFLGWTPALYFACGVVFVGAWIWLFLNPDPKPTG